MMHTRRAFLATLAAAAPLSAARVDRKRLSAITDEIGRTPAEAIAFARQYGLSWVELRGVPSVTSGRQEYFQLPEPELKAAAREFAAAGVKVSFLNTSMLKYWLPGTEPTNPRAKGGGGQRYENRVQELRKAIDAAHILGADKIRVFTFARVAEPEPLMPRLAEIVGELARIAEKEKVTLLVENEGSQNISTCAETAHLVKLVNSRALGINWDPLNGSRREKPFPEGYGILPRKKILNVQVKGRTILPGPDLLDWGAIFARLARDGYKGCVGLETHMGRGDELFQKSHEAMREMQRLAGAVS